MLAQTQECRERGSGERESGSGLSPTRAQHQPPNHLLRNSYHPSRLSPAMWVSEDGEKENRLQEKVTVILVGTIDNSQDMEATEMSMDRWMDKEMVGLPWWCIG